MPEMEQHKNDHQLFSNTAQEKCKGKDFLLFPAAFLLSCLR